MKLIIAMIQPHKLGDVKRALTNALGCGHRMAVASPRSPCRPVREVPSGRGPPAVVPRPGHFATCGKMARKRALLIAMRT